MSGQALIRAHLKTLVAGMLTTRDASRTFLPHVTATPFRESPARGGFEAFHIEAGAAERLATFGLPGSAEREWSLVVLLGIPPFGTDEEREAYAARDAERLADRIESSLWPTGVLSAFVDSYSIDRSRPLGWVIELPVRVRYFETVELAP